MLGVCSERTLELARNMWKRLEEAGGQAVMTATIGLVSG